MMAETKTCVHYKRNCKLVCPSCKNAYPCRFCHDETEDHHLIRHSVKEVECLNCLLQQPVSNNCITENCRTLFGQAYFCKVCVLFDNEDKKQYHCDGCGLCRVGGRENFFHCDRCKMCLSKEIDHKCIDEISLRNCAVCLEDIHTSRVQAHVPKCSHLIHKPCFEDLISAGIYSCPTCGTSLMDMKMVWKKLKDEIEVTPMPVEYRNMLCEIICKDCHKISNTTFHCLGLKCISCGSFNTAQSKGPFVADSNE